MPRAVALLLGFCLVACGIATASPAETAGRATWMREAHWGVMSHYLADWRERSDGERRSPAHWNELIDHFNVDVLADQLKSVGAGWFLLSIGQNSGYYLSPNQTYERLTGAAAGKLSHRDLVADLAAALARRGIRLMVYLPSGAPAQDTAAAAALGWRPGAARNATFQRNWEAVIREWSQRWGTRVAGWWFDGCYWPNTMYRHREPPNFASFAAAARAGNPAAVVAFNPGVVYRTLSITPQEDYLAGELDHPELWRPIRIVDGLVDGAQVHVLSFLGQRWGMGPPRFTAAQAVAFTQRVAGVGGVITWDTPLQKDGTYAPEFVAQLEAIGACFSLHTP